MHFTDMNCIFVFSLRIIIAKQKMYKKLILFEIIIIILIITTSFMFLFKFDVPFPNTY